MGAELELGWLTTTRKCWKQELTVVSPLEECDHVRRISKDILDCLEKLLVFCWSGEEKEKVRDLFKALGGELLSAVD